MASGAMPGTAHGKIVVDGSITHPAMGVLKEPITIYVENSFVTKIEGGEEAKRFAEELAKVGDPRMYRIGEDRHRPEPGCFPVRPYAGR